MALLEVRPQCRMIRPKFWSQNQVRLALPMIRPEFPSRNRVRVAPLEVQMHGEAEELVRTLIDETLENLRRCSRGWKCQDRQECGDIRKNGFCHFWLYIQIETLWAIFQYICAIVAT